MKLIEISIPGYQIDSPPDEKKIGTILDKLIIDNFPNEFILIRGIASSEHPNLTINELIDTIKKTGTDKYDPIRKGDRYENIDNKRIDLFAFPAHVNDSLAICDQLIYGFYHSAIGVHGRPFKVDILMIYNAKQMQKVPHKYFGRDDVKEDGFIFKDPKYKKRALLGIIKIL